VEGILAAPLAQRAGELTGLAVTAEHLICLCARLFERCDTAPSRVRDDGEFFYRFLEKAGEFTAVAGERQYFMGELALITGVVCRHTSRWDESRLWFDRAESGFRRTASSLGGISRLAYQRLALQMEERHVDAVLEFARPLAEELLGLGMPEEALKCRFLEGVALMESNRVLESVEVFEKARQDAERLRSEKLLGSACVNLSHLYGMMANSAKAIEASRMAIPILLRLNDRVALAKVQWGLARLFRETGQLTASIQAYRTARREFEQIGMRADEAALGLVIADLLLETGRDQEAMREILAVLPIIDELKMVPERVAALSLLRESLRQQKINRQALRDLQDFFEETKK
jgi:tetratricopeptide (TPR) repeat protein